MTDNKCPRCDALKELFPDADELVEQPDGTFRFSGATGAHSFPHLAPGEYEDARDRFGPIGPEKKEQQDGR